MKKIVNLMCAVATLAMVACGNGEEKNPANPDQGQEPAENIVSEGVYQPSAMIETVENDGIVETWEWDDGLLQSIVAEADGRDVNEYVFTYNGDKQLSQMSMTIQQMPVTMKYDYAGSNFGSKLSSFTATSSIVKLLDGTITHDANNHISAVDIELDSSMAGYLSSIIGNILGGDMLPDMGTTPAAKGNVASKMAIDRYTMHYDISWHGDNISSYVSTTTFQMLFTIEEIKALPLFDSMLAGYMTLIDMFVPAGSSVPIAMTLTDTNEYTYDNNPNPLRGLLRDLEPTALSYNNILTARTSSSISIALDLGFLTPFTMPSGEESHTYTYQYNSAGFPTQVSTDGQATITYIYKQ